ncbi:MAG TPA: T9SS type A sorting domain-containing protein, partial [Flavobacteriales bacterium]|nr:T9SS type A sorting domain-containing protein [Flavobacteriales bacterium]
LTGPNWGDGMFLARTDSTGVFEWGVESTSGDGSILGDMSRSKGPCITIDAANNLVLLGEVRGVVDWGSGYVSGSGQLTDRVITVVSPGLRASLAGEINPDGDPIWVANSTIGSGYKTAQSITAAAIPGAVYMAGHVRDPFHFGPHSVNEVDQQAAVFAMLVDLPTTLNVTSADNSVSAWPVPARTQVVLQVQQEHVGPAKLLASDGRTIRSLNLHSGQEVLDVQDLPPGAYFIRAANGAVVRIVKE